MKAPFSLFLALRYLKPKRTFVSLITIISILGVTLGIMVLIVVMSVMTGFDHELRRKVLGFDAHVLVKTDGFLHDWRSLDAQIQKIPGLVTAPFVEGPVIAEHDNLRLTPLIRGINLEREEKVTKIKSEIKEGAFDLSGDNCVVGVELAANLKLQVGDKLTIFSPKSVEELVDELDKAEKDTDSKKSLHELREMILPQDLTVTGIFESGRFVYDSEYVIVPLHIAQELYGLGDDVHGLSIWTQNPDDADDAPAVKARIAPLLPFPDVASTWMERNQELFDAIWMERRTMFFLLFFIVIVAAFGIMSTLITVTVQKTREIGIMKALGAGTGQIVWIFLAQGMVVGFFGNVIGLALGMSLIRWRNEFIAFLSNVLDIHIFPARIYQFNQLPAEIVPFDVARICISAFVICSVAALIPAYFAAKLDPVKALRYE